MVRELFHEAHSSILHRHAFFKEIGEHDNSMEVNLCSAAVSEAHVLAGRATIRTGHFERNTFAG